MEEVIKIRARAKSGGLTSLVLGGVALVIGSMVVAWLPDALRLAGIFIISGGLVGMLVGWFKLREPEHSLQLTKDAIEYHHRNGKWMIQWDNISRVDVPKVYRELQHQPLAMVGIRIIDYDDFLKAISPRLMSNILTEQRTLLVQTFKDQYKEGTKSLDDYSDYLIEDTEFTSEKGQKYKGLQAMFAHRMSRLREGLGYDLYINVTELDRSEEEFVSLLRECKSATQS